MAKSNHKLCTGLRVVARLVVVLVMAAALFGFASQGFGGRTVLAQATPTIIITPNNGPWGSTVTVNGSNFGANETGIRVRWDGVDITLAPGATASAAGAWSTTFTVPTLAAGVTHYVDAYGLATLHTSVVDVPFNVPSPSLNLSLTNGPWGSLVSVTGSGFGANETGVTVTYDGTDVPTVPTTVSANSSGSWSAIFTVPASTPGAHTVDARGATTPFGNVPNVTFTVPTPALTLSRTSGPVGTSVAVTGSGFGASETGITVTYDGTSVASSILASAQGGWSTTFTVPPSTSGTHSFGASGSTTQAGTVGQVNFAVTGGLGLSRVSGTVGSSVTVTGSGFAANETGITVRYDGVAAASGISADAQGGWSTTLTVPPSASGNHSIGASGSTTQASTVGVVSFTVAGSLTLSRVSGVPGSSATVTGSGFAANETGITVTYDGATVAVGISANAQGGWNTTLTVPPSASGQHSIGAFGTTTQASIVSSASFTVTGGITLGRTSGAPSGSVTVAGSGFAANETGITVTYDGATVATGIRADAQGGWSTTFTVPPSTSGSHNITASGTITLASSVGQASFTVTGGITLGRTSGAPGSSVTVSGSGFGANETGITVTYDGVAASSGISANGQGAWSTTLTVPPSASGPHSVGASGAITQSGIVSPANFVVTGGMTLGRSSGAPGSVVTVNGSGFAANETGITVTYDGATVASGVVANAQGGWSTTFTVPPSASGPHSIGASGNTTSPTSVGQAGFTVTGGIALGKTSGAPGSSVIVSGAGFNANETGITVTFDGTTVASGISANAQGGWSTTFTLPSSASGPHNVGASGNTTSASSVGQASFTVSGGIVVSRGSGTPGGSITVSGSGFAANETGITVMFDGATVASGISANAQGIWSATFTVPPSTSGNHNIAASGTVTQAALVGQASFSVAGGLTLSRNSGVSGGSITVSGAGFVSNETGITVNCDSAVVASGILANGQGAWSTTFTVPPSASGPHSIGAAGAITQPGVVSPASFAVTGGVTLGRSSGSPGTSVTVNGSGFAANETGITVTYDGTTVATGISANAQGGWSNAFNVPLSASGNHNIGASGTITQAGLVNPASFAVTGAIALGRSSGAPGSSVTISGSGFGANETGIAVTYDGATVAMGISANSQGGWSTTFTVPSSASGSHSIRAASPYTQATLTPETTFRVDPGISVTKTSESPGNPTTVSGYGFGANEGGIVVVFDNIPVVSHVNASAQGAWTASVIIPPSVSGSHSIRAYGSVTQASAVPEVGFTTMQTMSMTASSGYVGMKVDVTGAGFAGGSTLRLTYDGAEMTGDPITTNASGSFSRTVSVPKSKAGSHTIRVEDGQRGEAKAFFAVESTPPPVPALLSPRGGDRIGIVGGASPTLRWTAVADPSGVTYNIQVDTTSDLSSPVLDKTEVIHSSYTLTKDEALLRGNYYWRVQAVDGASNQSAWS